MIPKPIAEIQWADIESLRDAGREEDDTLEFKSEFSGGNDFLALSETARRRAVVGLAREAVAFLNARGGDIIVGAVEARNDHPRIESLTPVPNVDQTVDRLAQTLTAIIEPTQSILQIRSIKPCTDSNEGLIVIRAPASLRAPHRLIDDKECYVRRGRSSMKMAMDEIQDMTVRRLELRNERFAVLENEFHDLGYDRVGRVNLSKHRFHIKTVMMPLDSRQIIIDSRLLERLNVGDPDLCAGSNVEKIDLPFCNLRGRWQPVLRGQRIERLRLGGLRESDFNYCAKQIRQNGTFSQEFACRVTIGQDDPQNGFYFAWIAGYAANLLVTLTELFSANPLLGECIVRTGIFCDGSIVATSGDRWDREFFSWPTGVQFFPDDAIPALADRDAWLVQFQTDAASVCGFSVEQPYKFAERLEDLR